MNIDFEKIKELNKEIQDLLEEKPELRELQDQIDKIRETVGKKNRLAMIQTLMLDKFFELNEKLEELSILGKGCRGD